MRPEEGVLRPETMSFVQGVNHLTRSNMELKRTHLLPVGVAEVKNSRKINVKPVIESLDVTEMSLTGQMNNA